MKRPDLTDMPLLPRLGVNIDHIATLRQLRGTPYPDLLEAAAICENSGATQITVHLREDRRHVQDADVVALKKSLRCSLNFEMAVVPEILKFALKLQPDWACLVPEKREEQTTEGGLDVEKQGKKIEKTVSALKKKGIRVSLFVEPSIAAVKTSKELGADAVEIHTGRYCMAAQGFFGPTKSETIRKKEFDRVLKSGMLAKSLGMGSHAGHGFDYQNVRSVVAADVFEEFNIGHAIVCRAAIVGLERAVREMVLALHAPA